MGACPGIFGCAKSWLKAVVGDSCQSKLQNFPGKALGMATQTCSHRDQLGVYNLSFVISFFYTSPPPPALSLRNSGQPA